ncbi:hypothetical protein PIB30_085024, partial [Stylosanthes scabra]|nr:hypothetical protein [Stylosanthes scabra]
LPLPSNNPPEARSAPPTSAYATSFAAPPPPPPTIVSDIAFFTRFRLCKSTNNEDLLETQRETTDLSILDRDQQIFQEEAAFEVPPQDHRSLSPPSFISLIQSFILLTTRFGQAPISPSFKIAPN